MGLNSDGQLGNGTTINTNRPTNVASNAVAAAAGGNHSLFVTSDGTLWVMGLNESGQLGDGTTDSVSTPISVATNVVAVAAGYYHSLFVKMDGTLWAMGENNFGQLGNGTTIGTNLPVSVASNVVAVAAGEYHSLFVKADGTLWAMGYNGSGQLGNGTLNSTNLPTCVASNVVAVAAGYLHSLFVTRDGTLWAVGDNNFGALGSGGNYFNTDQPVSVASNVLAVAGGFYFSLFVKMDGTLWAMGENSLGQLGDGTTRDTNRPVCVPTLNLANVFPADLAWHSLAIGNFRAPAIVTLSNLNQIYTGGAISVTTTTIPPGLTVNLTYNGSTNAPTNPGSYTVSCTINDPNYYGSAGNTLLIRWPVTGPTNQVLPVGGTMTLSVTVGGPPPLSYQWFKDSRLLLGATNSTLMVANAGMTNSGAYYVVMTNGSGVMAISLSALVSVGNPRLAAWGNNDFGQWA